MNLQKTDELDTARPAIGAEFARLPRRVEADTAGPRQRRNVE